MGRQQESDSASYIPFEFARPSLPIAPSWLLFWEGMLTLLVGLCLSLPARVKSEGQDAPEQQ